jgi:hypothetical protein
MLLRLQRMFGFGRVYRLKDKRARRKPIWQFYVHNFGHVQAAIAFMWRWLTPEKQEQAIRALATYHAERAAKGMIHAISL